MGTGAFKRVMSRIAASGIQYIRTAVPWSIIQPSSSTSDPYWLGLFDAYFSALSASGLKAIVTLHSVAPAWAAVGGVSGNPPASWATYDTWVDYVLGRWGANIIAVEGVNEPNITPAPNAYYTGTTPQVITTLVTEMQHLYNRVRASTNSANITVLTPALAFAEVGYLKLMLDGGMGAYIDGVAIHPYPVRFDTNIIADPRVPWTDHSADYVTTVTGDANHLLSGVHIIHELMNSYGYGTKPVWVTEYGWAHKMSGDGLDATATMQADYVSTSLKQLARVSYVQCICPYAFRDNAGALADPAGTTPNPPITNWANRFGFAENWAGTERRPGEDAVRTAIAGNFATSSFLDYYRIGTTISGSSPKTWGNA
jgi:hypothetical protein